MYINLIPPPPLLQSESEFRERLNSSVESENRIESEDGSFVRDTFKLNASHEIRKSFCEIKIKNHSVFHKRKQCSDNTYTSNDLPLKTPKEITSIKCTRTLKQCVEGKKCVKERTIKSTTDEPP